MLWCSLTGASNFHNLLTTQRSCFLTIFDSLFSPANATFIPDSSPTGAPESNVVGEKMKKKTEVEEGEITGQTTLPEEMTASRRPSHLEVHSEAPIKKPSPSSSQTAPAPPQQEQPEKRTHQRRSPSPPQKREEVDTELQRQDAERKDDGIRGSSVAASGESKLDEDTAAARRMSHDSDSAKAKEHSKKSHHHEQKEVPAVEARLNSKDATGVEDGGEVVPPKPKRKRGRPPKHRPQQDTQLQVSRETKQANSSSSAIVDDSTVSTAASQQIHRKSSEQQQTPPTEAKRDETSDEAVDASGRVANSLVQPGPEVCATSKDAATSKVGRPEARSSSEEVIDKEGSSSRSERPPQSVDAEKPAQRPSLTIRIPNVTRRSPTSDAKDTSAATTLSAEPAAQSVITASAAASTSLELGSPKNKRRRDEMGGDSPDAGPPTKKFHIHIPASKSSSDTPVVPVGNDASAPVVAAEEEPKTTAPLDSSDAKESVDTREESSKPVSSSSLPPTLPSEDKEMIETEVPTPPESPKGRKKRKKLIISSVHAPVAPTVPDSKDDFPDALKTSAQRDDGGGAGSPMEVELAEVSAESRGSVIASQNSAFEAKPEREIPPVQSQLHAEDVKASTPRSRGKVPPQDSQPIVRSGRRAAQEANERIVSKPDTSAPQPEKKKRKRGRPRADGGDGEDHSEKEEQTDKESQWVRCDACEKWRIIPSKVVSSLPHQWFCKDNIYDPKRASCDAPEQTAKQAAKEKKKMKKRQRRLEAAQAAAAIAEGGKFLFVVCKPVTVSLFERTDLAIFP